MKSRLTSSHWKMNVLFSVVCLSMFFAAGAGASDCTISPVLPSAGHLVTVAYNPAGGPLDGVGSVQLHKGVNGWAQSDDVSMVLSNGWWTYTYLCPQMADTLNYAFHNGSEIWDSNGGADWNFSIPVPTIGTPPPLPATASKANVMMQGFYWDCPSEWYSTMAANAAELRFMQGGQGIDRIWFPPPQKSDSGGLSMGYDPYDYYDLGQYNQQGTIPTHFGTQAELKSTIAAYQAQGILCMADLVLNHRSGGMAESNPHLGGTNSWTDFSGVASGKCTWDYNQFHPSNYESSDEGSFGTYPDVCHVTGHSAGSAYYDLTEWGGWLQDSAHAGFDGGWRFDYVKGIHPSFMADFRVGTGNAFGILECWDNMEVIESYVKYSGNSSAFDFPAFYTMGEVFNEGAGISGLVDPTKVYAARRPSNAVTFVANHDTDKDAGVESITNNTMLAYAFILTYQGYPCIFWKDYFDRGLATLGGQSGNGIKPLVWVRGALGGGEPDIQLLNTNSTDVLIYGTSNGSASTPGYIVVLNNHDSTTQGATVTTSNSFLAGKTLQCHAWYSYVAGQNTQPVNVSCSAGGIVTVQAPPRGYAVYSVANALPGVWTSEDVGAVGLAGNASFMGDTFFLAGSGEDIQGGADGFRYTHQVISGDCAIQARVMHVENTDPWAKAGIMMRQGTAANAMNVAVLVTPENGVTFQWRNATGGGTGTANAGGLSAPCWVRLVRSANIFRGYYSEDGESWTQVGGSQTVNMSQAVNIGLAVTSHNNGSLATAIVDNVDLNAAPVADAISDQMILAGGNLMLTHSASDADVPVQTLTYSLKSPPVGASINSTNGAFSWRPLISQSPSLQTVSVAVSDNGVPMLGTTRSFNVTVARPAEPTLSSAVITNGQFSFSVDGDAGPDYTIQTTTNLTGGWTSVSNFHSPVLPFYWADTNQTASPVQFYRVRLAP
ncbi:carbohydrate-binding protein [Pontiellaceae bacterium B12227]|nr:carbohydrate-binding protein [Pontiellaceae bacterium B12227]